MVSFREFTRRRRANPQTGRKGLSRGRIKPTTPTTGSPSPQQLKIQLQEEAQRLENEREKERLKQEADDRRRQQKAIEQQRIREQELQAQTEAKRVVAEAARKKATIAQSQPLSSSKSSSQTENVIDRSSRKDRGSSILPSSRDIDSLVAIQKLFEKTETKTKEAGKKLRSVVLPKKLPTPLKGFEGAVAVDIPSKLAIGAGRPFLSAAKGFGKVITLQPTRVREKKEFSGQFTPAKGKKGDVGTSKLTFTREGLDPDVATFTGAVGIGVATQVPGVRALVSPALLSSGAFALTKAQTTEDIGEAAAVTLGGIATLPKTVKPIASFLRTKAKGKTQLTEREVFAPEVLAGKEPFPTARGKTTPEVLASFKESRTPKGDVLLASVAPKALRGKTFGEAKGGAGKGGREDPVLFATRAKRDEGIGGASPFFTRIEGIDGSSKITVNPFAGLRDLFSTPTVSIIKATDVKRLPPDVLQAKGFKPVGEFLKTQEGKGTAFITKRSEIGRGQAPGKGFKGTSEEEVGFPLGERFKEVSGKEFGRFQNAFTTFKGSKVDIRTVEILKKSQPKELSQGQGKQGKIITQEKISRETSSIIRPSKVQAFPSVISSPKSSRVSRTGELGSSFSSRREASSLISGRGARETGSPRALFSSRESSSSSRVGISRRSQGISRGRGQTRRGRGSSFTTGTSIFTPPPRRSVTQIFETPPPPTGRLPGRRIGEKKILVKVNKKSIEQFRPSQVGIERAKVFKEFISPRQFKGKTFIGVQTRAVPKKFKKFFTGGSSIAPSRIDPLARTGGAF